MMLWLLSKRTRIALSTINAQSLGVRYARPSLADDRVERSSSIGLDMAQKLSSDPNRAPTVTRRPTTGLIQTTRRHVGRADQLASLRVCEFTKGHQLFSRHGPNELRISPRK